MDFNETYPDMCSSLSLVAQAGDGEAVKLLIQKGYCVNLNDNRGWTPLHNAANAGEVKCVDLLCRQDEINIDAQTFEGLTALYLASKQGHAEVVQVLIDYGANARLYTNENASPLLAATQSKTNDPSFLKCAYILLEKGGADPDAQEAVNNCSPLDTAVYHGKVEMVKLLLKYCPDIEIPGQYGATPIYTAAQHGKVECLKLLLEAAWMQALLVDLINKSTEDQATPLFIATQGGHTECVKLLLENGANPNTGVKEIGEPRVYTVLPIQKVVIEFFDSLKANQLIELLLPVTNQKIMNSAFLHPISLAIFNSNTTAFDILMQHDLDINVTQEGWMWDIFDFSSTKFSCIDYFDVPVTPLSVATLLLKTKHIERLLAAGAKMYVDHKPRALADEVEDMVNRLFSNSGSREIEKEYSANVPYPLLTLLLRRSQTSKNAVTQIAKLLLQHGAEPTIMPEAHQGNLCLLLSVRNLETLKLLLLAGAEVESCFKLTDSASVFSFAEGLVRVHGTHACQSTIIGEALKLMLEFTGPVSLDTDLCALVDGEKQWNEIELMAGDPRSLMHLCRRRIRHTLGYKKLIKPETIDSLPVPLELKDFLMYKHLMSGD